MAGEVLLAAFVVGGLEAPWLAPRSPAAIDLLHRQSPTAAHWAGTDGWAGTRSRGSCGSRGYRSPSPSPRFWLFQKPLRGPTHMTRMMAGNATTLVSRKNRTQPILSDKTPPEEAITVRPSEASEASSAN